MYFLVSYTKPSNWEDLDFTVVVVCVRVRVRRHMCAHACISPLFIEKNFLNVWGKLAFYAFDYAFDFFRCHAILVYGNKCIFGRELIRQSIQRKGAVLNKMTFHWSIGVHFSILAWTCVCLWREISNSQPWPSEMQPMAVALALKISLLLQVWNSWRAYLRLDYVV